MGTLTARRRGDGLTGAVAVAVTLASCSMLAVSPQSAAARPGETVAEPPRHAAQEQGGSLVSLLPSGAAMFYWVDVAASREAMPESMMFPRPGMEGVAIPGIASVERLRELAASVGVDLERGIDEVAFSLLLPRGSPSPAEALLVAVRLDYDRAALEALLGDESVRPYGDHAIRTVYLERLLADDNAADPDPAEAEPAAPPERPLSLVTLDDRTILVGHDGPVRAALDVVAGERAPLNRDPRMLGLLARTPQRQHHLLMAVATDSIRENLPESVGPPPPALGMLATLHGVVASGVTTPDQESDLLLIGVAADEQAATMLRQTAEGFLAMGKMAVQRDAPELLDLLDRALRIEQQGDEVRVIIQLTREDNDLLRAFIAKRARIEQRR